jgi:FecR-like protein
MSDRGDADYLWNRGGDVDPDVARFERLLGQYAHRAGLRELPARDVLTAPRTPARVYHALQALAVAASVTLVVSAAWFASAERAAAWRVRTVQGTPAIDGRSVTTGPSTRAQIDVGEIGTVDVDPNSRVRLLHGGTNEHRMALDRGRIHARIAAPPRSFYVSTPAATAVDLGCAYTLEVDEAGWGALHVDLGWVAFEYHGRESFIPQGAVCEMRPGFGPGTPHYADSPRELADALTILDFSSTGDVKRTVALDQVLRSARRRDALTLWHLLARGSVSERQRVYDRMAALVPPPTGVTRERVLKGDSGAIDAWWDVLGLESASWWRLWKAPWRE